MSTRWPVLLGLVLVIPAALLAGWAGLTRGGAIDEQRALERQRAADALRQLEVDLHLTMRGAPVGTAHAPREVEDEALPLAAHVGLDEDRRGAPAAALAWFERVPAPHPLRVRLARARALIALDRAADARAVLAFEPEPGAALDGVPVALTVALLRAQAGAATDVWEQLRDGAVQVPPLALGPVLTTLGESGVTLTDEDVEDFRWITRARQALALGLVDRAAPVAPIDGGVWLRDRGELVAPRGLAAALARAAEDVATRMGVEVGADVTAEPLAEATIAGRHLVAAIPDALRGSARLQFAADACLVLALVAFLLGNLALLWNARRSAALSRLKTDFIDVVSHELRTPLTALAVKAEMLAAGDVPVAKVDAYQRALHAEVQRLSALVRDILDFGRLQRGRERLAPQRIGVRALVARAVRASRAALQLGGRRLVLDVPRQLPELEVDVDVLVRALRNLIDNATRHAPAGPIEVAASGGAGAVTLVVRDRGAGLQGADPRQLFEPFRRGRGSRPGSGLGLAIVDAAVRAHGGSVRAAERDGGGAEFRIDLPAGAA